MITFITTSVILWEGGEGVRPSHCGNYPSAEVGADIIERCVMRCVYSPVVLSCNSLKISQLVVGVVFVYCLALLGRVAKGREEGEARV